MKPGRDFSLQIDLDQFKLHLNLSDNESLSLHFDTPSRRFYLSVIALVVVEMKKKRDGGTFVSLETHGEILKLLNETVGESKGSSKRNKLIPRIYNKWKGALPDLETAPLFSVVGRKKSYDDGVVRTYRFEQASKDLWANLFEYRGSREKVKLRFAVEKLGIKAEDVQIVFHKGVDGAGAWNRFVSSLSGRAGKGDKREISDPEQTPKTLSASTGERHGNCVVETLKGWLDRKEEIEKIPLEDRLELIARLAGTPGVDNKPSQSKGGPSAQATESFGEEEAPSGFHMPISTLLLKGIPGDRESLRLYAAPEVREGEAPSPRSEVFALGVLLYQLVVGDLSRPLDPDWEQSVTDNVLRGDIAACVEPLPEKRLNDPQAVIHRLRTLNERRSILLPQHTLNTKKRSDSARRKRTWIGWGLTTAIIFVILALPVWYFQNVSRAEAEKRQAYKTKLPELRQLLESEKYIAAHALARETEKAIPGDPTLKRYLEEATNTLNIETVPEGANVSYRPYNDLKGPWLDLGVTPIGEAMVPVGMHRFKIKKNGYKERILVRAVVPRNAVSAEYENFAKPLFGNRFQFRLYTKNEVPDNMVPIDRGRFIVALKGVPVRTKGMVLERFFLDETEVTNRAYKEFVEAGGYTDPKFWQQEFRRGGRVIPWVEAMKTFVDRTGRPGPATWELADYPEGRGDYPVSGVSWYEAAAYARFRGKSLPTIYHWARAAFPVREVTTPLTPFIVSQSNIEGEDVAEAGRFPGTSSSGAKDMAGNVREWCWNAMGENRYCLGGAWHDPAYIFNESAAPSAWDRSSENGFRCAVYPADAPVAEAYFKEENLAFHDPYAIPPLSEKSFKAIKPLFAYEKTPLRPVLESSEKGGRGWVRETVSIDASYNKERVTIHLDLPTGCKPPYKAVIYFPGGNALYQHEFSRNFLWEPWDLIAKNGRALISPIYSCIFERGGGEPGLQDKKSDFRRFSEWVQDLGRTIDYLETRKDIDTETLAFLGVSMGALLGPILAPYEERIRSLILVSGCINLPAAKPKPKALRHPLLTIPVLMLNGKYDYIWPFRTHQKPLFDLIGTPREHKKHVIYNCGHLPLPRAPMMKEIFEWLDKYQGPVNCGKNPATLKLAETR